MVITSVIPIILVLATMNERFRHCISMTKMLNSENLLADSGLDPSTTGINADRILYNYAMEQCQSAALDELFGNPGECFQVIFRNIRKKRMLHSLIVVGLSLYKCIIFIIFIEIPRCSCPPACIAISNPERRRQKCVESIQRSR